MRSVVYILIDHNTLWVSGVGYLAKLNKQGEVLDLYTNKTG